jgi:group I intron endonuclease
MIKIYKITNKLNNKSYIGITSTSIEQRWNAHKAISSECTYIRNSIQKYGEENFKIEQIDIINTIEEANEKEIYWIKEYNTMVPNGYNLRDGGKYGKISEESKEKNRQSQYKRWSKKEELERQSSGMKERWKEEKDILYSGIKKYIEAKIKKYIAFNIKTKEILRFRTGSDAVKAGFNVYGITSKGFCFFIDKDQSSEELEKLSIEKINKAKTRKLIF